MNRWFIALSLAFALAFTSFADAKSSKGSGSSSPGDGGVHGTIASVAPTNFTIGQTGGHGRRHRRTKSIAVHYNPGSTTITVDGVTVGTLDIKAMGKYASVIGTMKNNVLEATSITVSSAPAHSKKRKSAA